jgi:hypothetical protein
MNDHTPVRMPGWYMKIVRKLDAETADRSDEILADTQGAYRFAAISMLSLTGLILLYIYALPALIVVFACLFVYQPWRIPKLTRWRKLYRHIQEYKQLQDRIAVKEQELADLSEELRRIDAG